MDMGCTVKSVLQIKGLSLGDMLGSAKLSKMAGHAAVHGCRFSMVQGAHSGNEKGAKYQYYPLALPQGEEFNEDCPPYDILRLPIRTMKGYWEAINRLEGAKGNKTKHAKIVQETDVTDFPFCAASCRDQHPLDVHRRAPAVQGPAEAHRRL